MDASLERSIPRDAGALGPAGRSGSIPKLDREGRRRYFQGMRRPSLALCGLGIIVAGAAAACATPGVDVNVRKTSDFREISYRSIAPAEEEAPPGFRRERLPEALEAKAWEVMKIHLVPARWEFADVEGTDLVVHFGAGRAPEDRVDDIGEHSLVVDIFERETGERVWFGFAEDLEPLDEEGVERVISEMMLRFPKVPPRPAAY